MGFAQEQPIAKKLDYGTPPDLFLGFDGLFSFDLDACARKDNRLVHRHLGPGGLAEDALAVNWEDYGSRIWCNFPYLRGTQHSWLERALSASRAPNTLVACLCFARLATGWWVEWTRHADTVFMLHPRVKYVGATSGAQVPSAVILYTPWSVGPPVYRPYKWR